MPWAPTLFRFIWHSAKPYCLRYSSAVSSLAYLVIRASSQQGRSLSLVLCLTSAGSMQTWTWYGPLICHSYSQRGYWATWWGRMGNCPHKALVILHVCCQLGHVIETIPGPAGSCWQTMCQVLEIFCLQGLWGWLGIIQLNLVEHHVYVGPGRECWPQSTGPPWPPLPSVSLRPRPRPWPYWGYR
jgi:hypothetical protein